MLGHCRPNFLYHVTIWDFTWLSMHRLLQAYPSRPNRPWKIAIILRMYVRTRCSPGKNYEMHWAISGSVRSPHHTPSLDTDLQASTALKNYKSSYHKDTNCKIRLCSRWQFHSNKPWAILTRQWKVYWYRPIEYSRLSRLAQLCPFESRVQNHMGPVWIHLEWGSCWNVTWQTLRMREKQTYNR